MLTIQIKALPNHLATGRIKTKLIGAFERLGHKITENSDEADIYLILGEAGDWADDQKVKCKKVLWNHGLWIKERCEALEIPQNIKINDVYKNVDAVAYHSEYSRNAMWKYLGKREGPIIFNADKDHLALWNATDLKEIRLVACAIPRPLKRFDEMERLTEVLISKGYPVKLTLMGNDKFWSDEEMDAEYRRSHIALNFGFNDNSPATVGEAMSYGIPTITTNSGGGKEMIDYAGVVLIADPDPSYEFFMDYPKINDDEFVKAFEQIVENYPEYVEKTRTRVIGIMNIDESARQLVKLFEEIK